MGATMVTMTTDSANSSAAGHGSNITGTISDSFAYDPDAPQSTSPIQYWGSSHGYHAEVAGGGDVFLSYTFAQQSIDSTSSSVHIDLWGRYETLVSHTARDSDFDLVLYDGDYTSAVARIDGLDIVYDDGSYLRSSFTGLAAGTTFDRLQLVAHDSEASSGSNNFTLMEIRMATEGVTTVPEPSAIALLTLGASCLLWRRRA